VRLGFLLLALLAGAGLAQDRQSLVSSRVTVAGEVRRELTLTLDDLRDLARRRGEAEGRGYAGVRLTDILDEADVRRDARHALRRSYVVATAGDGFVAVFSWSELFDTPIGAGVLVAYHRDGQPLRDGEGRIALVSLADQRPSTRHVKWLSRIEVKRVPE